MLRIQPRELDDESKLGDLKEEEGEEEDEEEEEEKEKNYAHQ